MANEQNLIPLNKRSQRDRKRIATAGANASNKVQREKKLMKEQLQVLMSLNLQDTELKSQLENLGIEENEITIQMAICVSIMQQAINGNIRAFEIIREIPIKEIQVEEQETIIFINDIQDLANNNLKGVIL